MNSSAASPPADDRGETFGSGHRLIAPHLLRIDPHGRPRLLGGKCQTCGALSFPGGEVCTECLSDQVQPVELNDRGRLYTFSVVHQAPKGWSVPYVLGYVDLDEGVRVLSHITCDASAIAVDQIVHLGVGVVGADADGRPLETYVFRTEA